jgi:lysophospholipase L1-like esterase
LQERHNLDDLGVLNEGINGDRLLSEGNFAPNASKRFDRDVIARAGVHYVTVLIGINDIGHSALGDGPTVTPADLITGYRQLIARAHEKGLTIYGATLTPMGGSRYDLPAAQALRDAVNDWIRTSGEFDAVIDFDQATRDPGQPSRLLPLYDSGDHLHPNDAGYQGMGEAVPLRLFKENIFSKH